MLIFSSSFNSSNYQIIGIPTITISIKRQQCSDSAAVQCFVYLVLFAGIGKRCFCTTDATLIREEGKGVGGVSKITLNLSCSLFLPQNERKNNLICSPKSMFPFYIRQTQQSLCSPKAKCCPHAPAMFTQIRNFV